MPTKTLKEIAATDVQVARFLDRASASRQEAKAQAQAQATQETYSPDGTKLHYQKNHLPKGRNISKEARDAITACILG